MKGNETNCNNYKGNFLLDVTYKLMSVFTKKRLQQKGEDFLGDCQVCSRQNEVNF